MPIRFRLMILMICLFSQSLLLSCSHSQESENKKPKIALELYHLEKAPIWGTTSSGQNISAGGFSGLIYLGKSAQNEYQFLSLTDRGPNAETVKISGIGAGARPFILPDFQPRLMKIETHSVQKTFRILEEIPLTDPHGKALSGRPPSSARKTDKAREDETPVNLQAERLSNDLAGIDPEGIAVDADGFIWLCEEYRPSLLKFNPQGRLIKHFIPIKSLTKTELTQI